MWQDKLICPNCDNDKGYIVNEACGLDPSCENFIWECTECSTRLDIEVKHKEIELEVEDA